MSTIPDNTTTTPPVTTPTSSTRTTADAQKTLNGNYQDFLKLLTTQLTNQDPTQPIDTNQLTAQIASLSQVEQGINTNTKLDQLIALYSASQVNNAVSYIGKQVDATGNQLDLENSKASLVYNLPAGTSSATVTITDSAGKTMFSGPGTTLAGRNQVLWNGLNSTTGATMADGTYSFSVAAKDAAGKALTATTFTTGTVSAVDTADGNTSLSLGHISVPIANVQSIYNAGANPGA